jgi:hypothetical protein
MPQAGTRQIPLNGPQELVIDVFKLGHGGIGII